jgi:hypothetical protein
VSLNGSLEISASEVNYFCVLTALGRSKFHKPADNVTQTSRSTSAHFESYKSFEQNTMKWLPAWDPNEIVGGGGTVG